MTPTDKALCRRLTIKAIRDGLLEKKDGCEQCGSSHQIHCHHLDYSDPLKVIWLCRSCHMKAHGKMAHAPQPKDPNMYHFVLTDESTARLRRLAKSSGVSIPALVGRALKSLEREESRLSS